MSKVVTLDFETYYHKSDYSLSNMTTSEYVRHPMFQIIGVAVSVNFEQPKWFSSSSVKEVAEFISTYNLEKEGTLTVAHNAMFDGAVLEWVLGIKPWRYFCTMMGSRPYYAQHTGSMSLAALSIALGSGVKGTEVKTASGKRLEDFNSSELMNYAAYCIQDVALTNDLFIDLVKRYPREELRLLDLTIKKFTRPSLRLNKEVLQEALKDEQANKFDLIQKAGVEQSELMSNPKFAKLLEKYNVNVPYKTSPTTGKQTFAFAKSDPGFKKLLNHPNPQVVALCEARLAWKSTITETRLSRFLDVAENSPDQQLPVPLLYYGAHPGRFSGFDKLNLQNLGRGSPLRRAIIAPPGHKVVAGDLSQIEARITACLAGEQQLVDAFRYYDGLIDSDRDVYCQFGDSVYGRQITKADELERFVSKTGVLSLGYQSGAQKFYDSMRGFGLDDFTLSMAEDVVNTYRSLYTQIVGQWRTMEGLIRSMQSGTVTQYGPVRTDKNKIYLPNGMYLDYPDLTNSGGRYIYRSGSSKRDLYGGKLTENIVQALARIVMTTAELRLAKAGLKAALSVHDELVFVVPDSQVERVKKALHMALTAKVPWMPDLPVNCEIGVGDNYAEAK